MRAAVAIAAFAGFVVAFGCCLPFVRWDRSAQGEKPKGSTRPLPGAAAPIRAVTFEDELRQFRTGDVSHEASLRLAWRAGGLAYGGRERALAELLKWSETERREALTVLVLRWAETDPGAAVRWVREHLEQNERRAIMRDLISTWAFRDGRGLSDWWVENTPEDEVFRGDGSEVMNILSRMDPLAYAAHMDKPEMHAISVVGLVSPLALPEGAEISVFAEALVGNVGYEAGAAEELKQNSTGRHQRGKCGWNELFEHVARAYHRHSPEGCEAWLARFPEPAQIAARHRIGK